MQSVAVLDQRMIKDHQERRRALNNATQRLVQRLFGCWQHELSRPFTNKGRTYRVCMKCGLSRDFNLTIWKTQGGSYVMPVHWGKSFWKAPEKSDNAISKEERTREKQLAAKRKKENADQSRYGLFWSAFFFYFLKVIFTNGITFGSSCCSRSKLSKS